MTVIIYESNAGSTRKYAEMLAAKLGVSAYPLKEALKSVPRGERIIFLGWVFANRIQGLKKAAKHWRIICAGAVGMNPDCVTYREILKSSNAAAADAPIFYMRGALDYQKLRRLQRKLMQTIRIDLEKQSKPDSGEMISILRDGCDFVCEENITNILAFAMLNG